jgi:hypothetical protein
MPQGGLALALAFLIPYRLRPRPFGYRLRPRLIGLYMVCVLTLTIGLTWTFGTKPRNKLPRTSWALLGQLGPSRTSSPYTQLTAARDTQSGSTVARTGLPRSCPAAPESHQPRVRHRYIRALHATPAPRPLQPSHRLPPPEGGGPLTTPPGRAHGPLRRGNGVRDRSTVGPA